MVLVPCTCCIILGPRFLQVFQRISELQTQTVGSTLQFTKGYKSVKTVDGIMVLNLYIFLIMLYICTKFQGNISKGFTVIE